MKRVYVAGVFHGKTELESNDMMVMSKESVREIFDIPDTKATDIVVQVSNPNEVEIVVQKLASLFPHAKIITKEDLKVSYENIFNYKSGIFLALFAIALFTFLLLFMIKSVVSAVKKKEK